MNDAHRLTRSRPSEPARGTPCTPAQAIEKAEVVRMTMNVHFATAWSQDFADSPLVLRAQSELLDVMATLEAEAGVTIEELGIAGFVPGRENEAERAADHPDIEALVASDASGWIAACRSLANPPRVTWEPDADSAALAQVTWTRRALATKPAASSLDALLRAAAAGKDWADWLEGEEEHPYLRWEMQAASLALMDAVVAYLAATPPVPSPTMA